MQPTDPTRTVELKTEFDPNTVFRRGDDIVAIGTTSWASEPVIKVAILDVKDVKSDIGETTSFKTEIGDVPRASSVKIGGKLATTILVAATLLASSMDHIRALLATVTKAFNSDGNLLNSMFNTLGAAARVRTTKFVVRFDDKTEVLPDLPGIDHKTDNVDQVDNSMGMKVAGIIGKPFLFTYSLVRRFGENKLDEVWAKIDLPGTFGDFLGIMKTTGEKIVATTADGFYVPIALQDGVLSIDTLSAFKLDATTRTALGLKQGEYVSGPSPIGVTIVGYNEDGTKYVRSANFADILGTPLAYLFTQIYGPNWLEGCALPAVVTKTRQALDVAQT